ncbi:MAG: hydantoinase/oxoprolinase N-terminal domain-containing protein [Eggerthella lenta]
MADQKRIWRLGIDVGGTNTDAVVIDGDLKLVAATKSPTTEDVMSGIVAAMHEVITQIGADAARNIGFAMLGTTHCTNAIVERKRLNKVAALRVGAPATTAISCMADWPDELKNAMRVRDFLVHGGNEFDGREISALSEDEIREVARVVREEGFESVAVTSVFSPVSDAHEKRAAAVLREELGEGFPITLSSEIGSLGFLERENASILNAALYDVARTTADSFEAALASEGLTDVAVYLGQNDGTLMSVDYAKRYPIFTIACGPTNSIRGASFLTQEKDAVVVDIGGTTTDVGVLAHGFPRESMVAVEIGDVRTNFRMPDLVSVGLGGGSLVRQLEDGSVTVRQRGLPGHEEGAVLRRRHADRDRYRGGEGLAEGVGDPHWWPTSTRARGRGLCRDHAHHRGCGGRHEDLGRRCDGDPRGRRLHSGS